MKLMQFGIVGVFVQAACLIMFIIASRSPVAGFAKPGVIVLAFASMVLLLSWGVKNAAGWLSLCLLPVILAAGYLVAFHLVGAILFRGLLRDVSPPYEEYVISNLRVMGVLLLLYGTATFVLASLRKVWRKRT